MHNVRSLEQWMILTQHIDFQGKIVLDLGFGKGDILCRAFDAGAITTGIENNGANIKHVCNIHPEIETIEKDIDLLTIEFLMGLTRYHADIIICFSVLPYLRRPELTLEWINHHSEIALIECQYAGDGPGLSFLTDNDDMREWLLAAGKFEKVKVIGHTLVEGRNKNRFIWMCE